MFVFWMGLLGTAEAKCTDKKCDAPELEECNSDPKECRELGIQYADEASKKNAREDLEIARNLWVYSCSQEDSVACQRLSDLYLYGYLGKPSKSKAKKYAGKAIDLHQKGCQQENPEDCTNLGIEYLWGFVLKQDRMKGVELLTKGCDGADPIGCLSLGKLYADDNPSKAVALLERSCELQLGEGCLASAYAHEYPSAGNMNIAEVIKWYQKGCDTGNGTSCNNLGTKYLVGIGVPKDELKALELFEKSCTLQESIGCFNLASNYEEGKQGVFEKDFTKSIYFYQKSCELDDFTACQKIKQLTQSP